MDLCCCLQEMCALCLFIIVVGVAPGAYILTQIKYYNKPESE